MLPRFVYISQSLRPIGPVHHTLGDFSICPLIHCPRRIAFNTFFTKLLSHPVHLSTFGRFKGSSERRANTNSDLKEPSSFRSIAAHRDDGSRDSTSAFRDAYQVEDSKAFSGAKSREFGGLSKEKLDPKKAEVTNIRSNGFSRLHISPTDNRSLRTKNNDGLLPDEKSGDRTRTGELGDHSDVVGRNNLRPEVLLNKTTVLPIRKVKERRDIEETKDAVPSNKSTVIAQSTSGSPGTVGSPLIKENPVALRIAPLCEFVPPSNTPCEDESPGLIRKHVLRSRNLNKNKNRARYKLAQPPKDPLPGLTIRKVISSNDENHLGDPGNTSQVGESVGEIRPIFHQTRGPKRETSNRKEIHLRASRVLDIDGSRTPLDKFSLTWCMRYAVIVGRKWSLKPWPKSSNLIWQNLITLEMDANAILQAWSKFPVKQLDEIWQDFMLWALQHSPERALKVLDVTISEGIPKMPRYVLGNCLDYLAAFFLEGLKSWDSIKLDRILGLTCKFVHDSGFEDGGHSPFIDQRTAYLVLTCCRNNQAQYFWDVLVQHHTDLTPWTLLQFLGKFADMLDMSRSLEVLCRVMQTPLSLASTDVQYGCAKLLRARPDGQNWYDTQTHLWTQLLHMGIPPSIHMYNAMVHNCVEADDYDVALIMYNKIRETNSEANTLTYHSLLGGLEHGWDFDILDLVVHDAEADGLLPESEFLVCAILSAASRLEFPKLLQLYGRYYDPSPLYDFGFIKPGQYRLNPITAPKAPPSLAVAILLTTYITQCQDWNEVIGLYGRYTALSRDRYLHATAMAGSDYVSNAFIQAFGQRPETLELCTTVIQAMLRPAPPPVYIFESAEPIEVSPPTTISWTLLLQAFCRHGQMLAAEKVMSMMRNRGVEPSHMTWSILIYGHAAAQDIDGAVGAVKRMEAAGFSVNDHIVLALGMYRDRDRLLKALDDATKEDPETEIDTEDGRGDVQVAEEETVQPTQETEAGLRLHCRHCITHV